MLKVPITVISRGSHWLMSEGTCSTPTWSGVVECFILQNWLMFLWVGRIPLPPRVHSGHHYDSFLSFLILKATHKHRWNFCLEWWCPFAILVTRSTRTRNLWLVNKICQPDRFLVYFVDETEEDVEIANFSCIVHFEILVRFSASDFTPKL